MRKILYLQILSIGIVSFLIACSSGTDANPGSPGTSEQTGSEASSATPLAEKSTDSVGERTNQSPSGDATGGEKAADPKDPSANTNAGAATNKEGNLQMVDVQLGQEFQAGTRVNFPNVGLSFIVPQGWLGGVPQGAQAFVLQSPNNAGFVLVTSHQSDSADMIIAELQQPVELDTGFFMRLAAQPEVSGEWVTAAVNGTDGSDQIPGFLMAQVPTNEVGALFIGFGEDGSDFYRQLLSQLTETLIETTVKVASPESDLSGGRATGSSDEAEEWAQFLQGKRATYLDSYSSGGATGGGYSTKIEYDLCTDGRFFSDDSSSISGGSFGSFSGGGNLGSSGSGSWSIIAEAGQFGLELRWADGSISQRLLEYIDEATYMDGERWFITPDNTSCP